MWDVQEAANKPALVRCAISKRISAAYHRSTFLRTLSFLLHGGDDLLILLSLIDSHDRRTREKRFPLVRHRR